MSNIILEAINIKKYFPLKSGIIGKTQGFVRAVDNVSLTLYEKEILALVGESGSGKSTLGRILIGLMHPTEGKVLFRGKDIFKLRGKESKEIRQKLQIIFQNPDSSLNPRMQVYDIIEEALKERNPDMKKDEYLEKIIELLYIVGLNPDHAYKYPIELSGGEKQRVAIARALAMEPEVIVADEPVSALDVSIRAQILNLLLDIQEKMGISIVFIAHDLSTVWNISDRIIVMYTGKIMEEGTTEEIFKDPRHPYTKILIESAPRIPFKRNDPLLKPRGEPASPINPPKGCRFHTRCPFKKPICVEAEPKLIQITDTHEVACHFP